MKKYVGYIWIGDDPGVRLSVWARSSSEAVALVRAEHGDGHPMTLWNEEEARRPRPSAKDCRPPSFDEGSDNDA